MEDYIEILINELEEQWSGLLGREYFLQKARADRVAEVFLDTLTEKQHALFLVYEEQRNAAEAFRESCMTRQAFLLAREIFR